MTPKRLLRQFLFYILLTLCLGTPAFSAPEEPIAEMTISPAGVTWTPRVEHSSLVLTVAAPDGEVFRQEFKQGTNPSFSLVNQNGIKLPDGHYTYELRLVPVISEETRAALAATRERGDGEDVKRALRRDGQLPARGKVQSGSFLVLQGAIVSNSATEPKSSVKSTSTYSNELTVGESAPPPGDLPNDTVTPDDAIIQGSACIGVGCVDNEVFLETVLLLKENNLRLEFEDTSTGLFPSTDWQITVNDTESGGVNKFSIEDLTAATVPFTIAGGAPSNSIYVSSDGRVGLGTSAPGLEFHMNSSDTPSVRLEQNNAGGFTAQTWDIGANEANFFIRDLTGGSKLSFRIRPGAPTSSIDIDGNGNVGIGNDDPQANLDILADPLEGGASGLRISHAVDNDNTTPLAYLYNNNGYGQLELYQSSGTKTVQISSNFSTFFNAGNVGIGTSTPAYKLEVAGSLNATSLYINGTQFDPTGLASGTGTTGNVVKWNDGAASTLTDSILYDSGTAVGVGTNTPGYTLDVAGSLNATSLYVNGTALNTTSLVSGMGTTGKMVKWDNGASRTLSDSVVFDDGSGVGVGTTDLSDVLISGNDKLKIVDGNMTFSFRDFFNGQGYFAVGSSTNGIKGFIGHTNTNDGFTLGTFTNHKLTIRTNSVNRLTIDTSGNVGIGTSAPQSTLQVNGYVQLALTSGAPPAADCDNSSEYGRMKVDATNSKLYVCTATGWKSTTLTP